MSKIRNQIVKMAQKLEETDYAVFDHEYGDAMDNLNRCFDNITDYQNSVIREITDTPFIMLHSDDEEQQSKLEELKSRRRSNHDAAVTSINELNHICERCDIEPFADIDTKDRQAVTDFVGNFCSQLFEDGKQRTEDELMDYRWDRRDLYDTNDLLDKIMNNSNEDKGPEME